MEKFNELLRSLDIKYFGSGNHKISFEKFMELKKNDAVVLLDVRSDEENEWVTFNFAKHVPINEIPDRINEIPTDKTIAVFCSSATRATIVFCYLRMIGYDAKILMDHIGDLAGNIKPGFVLKNLQQ